MATTDLPPIIPVQVECVFPATYPLAVHAPYSVTVTLASLALPEFAGALSNPNATMVLESTQQAIYDNTNTLTNGADLGTLATQMATDWYRWQLGKVDLVYAGLCNWVPEGLSDAIEYIHAGKHISTRIQRGTLHIFNDGGQSPLIPPVPPSSGIGSAIYVRVVIQPQYPSFPSYSFSGGIITGSGLLGTQFADGVSLAMNDPVLFNNDIEPHTGGADPSFGVYVVTSTNPWTLSPMPGVTYANGMIVEVGPEGTNNKNTLWQLRTPQPITVGTTSIAFLRDDPQKKLVKYTGPFEFTAHGIKWYDGTLYANDTTAGYGEAIWVGDANNNPGGPPFYHAIRAFDQPNGSVFRASYLTNIFAGGGNLGGGGIINAKTYTTVLPAFTASGPTNNILTMNSVGILTLNGWSSFSIGDLILYDPSALGSISPDPLGGVYSVTNPGSGGVAAILTRTSYDLTINKINIGPGPTVPALGTPFTTPLQFKFGFPLAVLEIGTPLPIVPGTTPMQFGFVPEYVPGGPQAVDTYTPTLDTYDKSQTVNPSDTYTKHTNGALTIDGVSMSVGKTLLFNPGTSDGGWFVVTSAGSGGSKWVIQRTDGTNTTIPGFIQSSTPTLIKNGTYFKNSISTVLTADPITIGTTAISFGDPIRGGCSCIQPADVYQSTPFPAYAKTQTITPGDTYTETAGGGTGALPNVDGITPTIGMVILYNPGTADGGWFKVVQVGDGSHPFILQRTDKTNTAVPGEITSGTITPIRSGTQYGTKTFFLTTPDTITLGTTALSFVLPPDTVNDTVATDQNTTSSSQMDVTGLSFAIGANEVWSGEVNLYATGALVGSGMTFSLTGPASPTNVRIFTMGDTTGVTVISTDSQTAYATPTQAYIIGAFSGMVTIKFTIENGANAGMIQLQFASNTNGQSNTILRGSYMTARKVR